MEEIHKARLHSIPEDVKLKILNFLRDDLKRNEYAQMAWSTGETWYFSKPATESSYFEVPNSMMAATKSWLESLGGFYTRPMRNPYSGHICGYDVYLK